MFSSVINWEMSVFSVRPLSMLTGKLSGKGGKKKQMQEKQNLEYVINICSVKHVPASTLVHSVSNSAQTGPREWRKQAKGVLWERRRRVFVEVSEFSMRSNPWSSLLFHPSHTLSLLVNRAECGNTHFQTANRSWRRLECWPNRLQIENSDKRCSNFCY